MARSRMWLLPALFAVAQLAWWPGVAYARGDAAEPVRAAVVAAVVLVVCGALGWRRRAPVVATAVVAAGVGVGTWVTSAQGLLAPGDALAGLSFAGPVALFSVAVCCSRRTTLIVFAALEAWQAVVSAGQGIGPDLVVDVVMSAGLDLFVVAAGRVRRRWVADRADAARRLAAAEEAEREAAGTERRRLARELHDVTAHHLTSIVVQASAAKLLGEQRPELRAAALDHAARTGRETLDALRRLVAILPEGAEAPEVPVPSLADLADDFGQLGQVVTVETTGTAPREVAEAAHAIAREALTNTLRYAPGGTVRVRFSYGPGAAELVIEDDGAASPGAAAGLGGGRGLTGMRDRAEALGGTFTAGPRTGAGTGWRVHVVFPPPAAAGPAGRVRRWLRGQTVFDAGVAGLTLMMPLSAVAVAVDEHSLAAGLLLPPVVARAAPLLWRRWHPWAVLAAVVAAGWFCPLLVVTHLAPRDVAWLFAAGVGADLVAVYTVAALTRPATSWLAAAAALVSGVCVLAVLVINDPDESSGLVLVVLTASALVTLVFLPPLGASWLAGFAVRRRRRFRAEREEGAVAFVSARAEWRARDERARVAAGLREAVVEHAARVPLAAGEADLDGVVDSARAALAAMRALLDGMSRAERVPSPGPAYSSLAG